MSAPVKDMTRGNPAKLIVLFALPMMVGIACGCYSSVCVAGPLYAMWQRHKANVRAAAVPAAKKK